MKVAIEPFLFDNTLMNCCVFSLTAAWLGIRVRLLPILSVSFLGAVYALASLFLLPELREPYIKLPVFLAGSLPLYRRAGPFYRVLPFLVLSAATTGGTALMLTLLLGGSVSYDGTLIGTIPVRAALLSAFSAICLPRLMRSLLYMRRKRSLHTQVCIRLQIHTYRLNALIDSGNLLREPVSGLPVLLIDRSIDGPGRSRFTEFREKEFCTASIRFALRCRNTAMPQSTAYARNHRNRSTERRQSCRKL